MCRAPIPTRSTSMSAASTVSISRRSTSSSLTAGTGNTPWRSGCLGDSWYASITKTPVSPASSITSRGCRGDRAMKSVPLDGEIRDGRHVLTVRVYYEDTDFTGIVYHASYLRFMERGRTNYLRMIGADHRALFEETAKEAPGFSFVVRSMTIEFLKPARMDDVLEVVTEPHDVKGASAMVRQRVMRGDELLVEAHVRVAFISGGRARPIPKPLRIAMMADQDAAQG